MFIDMLGNGREWLCTPLESAEVLSSLFELEQTTTTEPIISRFYI